MEPIQILASIYVGYPTLWKQNLTHSKLIKILKIDCAPARVTEALRSPEKASKKITEALGEPDTQKVIAKLFSCPALFNCETNADLTNILPVEPSLESSHQAARLKIINAAVEESSEEDPQLADTELEVFKELQSVITMSDEQLILWNAERFTGANFISSLLRPRDLDSCYEEVIQLSPTSCSDAFNSVRIPMHPAT